MSTYMHSSTHDLNDVRHPPKISIRCLHTNTGILSCFCIAREFFFFQKGLRWHTVVWCLLYDMHVPSNITHGKRTIINSVQVRKSHPLSNNRFPTGRILTSALIDVMYTVLVKYMCKGRTIG